MKPAQPGAQSPSNSVTVAPKADRQNYSTSPRIKQTNPTISLKECLLAMAYPFIWLAEKITELCTFCFSCCSTEPDEENLLGPTITQSPSSSTDSINTLEVEEDPYNLSKQDIDHIKRSLVDFDACLSNHVGYFHQSEVEPLIAQIKRQRMIPLGKSTQAKQAIMLWHSICDETIGYLKWCESETLEQLPDRLVELIKKSSEWEEETAKQYMAATSDKGIRVFKAASAQIHFKSKAKFTKKYNKRRNAFIGEITERYSNHPNRFAMNQALDKLFNILPKDQRVLGINISSHTDTWVKNIIMYHTLALHEISPEEFI
ncbi:hypothetical protein [Kistimonas asteriae]|uniref:hypothetical protein n=1 Tax=Kistimonas asteriae TaxID=517724 RepID=UPI001BAD26B6|nr:hypothetical protein [Kistimonas asteriae]